MKSKATDKFWKLYGRLPHAEQQRARKAYQLWQKHPEAPGLAFKRVSDQEPVYSIRIGQDYRALGLLEGDTVLWFWIGEHDKYERILK